MFSPEMHIWHLRPKVKAWWEYGSYPRLIVPLETFSHGLSSGKLTEELAAICRHCPELADQHRRLSDSTEKRRAWMQQSRQCKPDEQSSNWRKFWAQMGKSSLQVREWNYGREIRGGVWLMLPNAAPWKLMNWKKKKKIYKEVGFCFLVSFSLLRMKYGQTVGRSQWKARDIHRDCFRDTESLKTF